MENNENELDVLYETEPENNIIENEEVIKETTRFVSNFNSVVHKGNNTLNKFGKKYKKERQRKNKQSRRMRSLNRK